MTTLVLERSFPVDPQTVFAFVTETNHLLKWWGPEGLTVPEHNLDFTRPGPWSSIMMNTDGARFKVTGEVIAVDPPHSVEFSWAWHDENGQRDHESTVRFEVRANEKGGSIFVMTHRNLPDEESRNNHQGGWSSSFRKLERAINAI